MNMFCKYIAVMAAVAAPALSIHPASAQSFKKGVLLVSLSEGRTHANFSTKNTSVPDGAVNYIKTDGDRDPITIEYGLTKHWGLGINIGTDILKVDPKTFYGFQTGSGQVKVFMSEVTLDASFHLLVTKHTDLCGFISVGPSTFTVKGNDGDYAYKYTATGGIVRVGSKFKYYPCKRFGLMAMISTYSTSCSTKGIKDNTVGSGYTTGINGWALEFGPCIRFF